MDCFVEGGVYVRAGNDTCLYVCSVEHNMAKLIEYIQLDESYKRTGNQYFLNYFRSLDADFKSYITNPANYEQIGKLNMNFRLYSDKLYALSEKT